MRFFLLHRAGVFVYFYLELLFMFVSVLFSSSACNIVQSQYVFRFCFVFHIDQCFFKPPFLSFCVYVPLFCTYFRTQYFIVRKFAFLLVVGGGVRRPGGRTVAAVFQNKKMENMKIKAKKDRPDNNRALLLLAE